MQLTSPIVNNTNCISNSANNTNINNNNHTSNNNNEMVVSESNKPPSHIINLFNHHHSTLTSPSASSTVPGSLTVPRDSFSCRKVFGVILVDERMIIRHLCGSSDLIDLEYKNHLLLGSIVVDKESMSIDELRRIITEQISNLPKNYAFFSKEGWPLTISQECKLKFCNLVNKRNIICIRKVYDKPRIGALTDSGEYLGSFFCNYDCTLSDLRRILDDIFRDSENNSRLAKFMDYRFIDRNEWPVVRSHEDQLTLLDILINQNVLLRPNLSGSFTSSCPAIKDARGDSNVGLEHDGRLTSLSKQIVTTPSSPDDRIDSWKGDTLRRSSKKRNIM